MSAPQTATAASGPAAIGHEEAIIELARKLRLDNRLDEAEAALKDFLDEDTPSHAGWLEHGACRRKRGDLDGALSSFSRAAAAMPAHLGTKVQIASTLRALNRLPEAAELLDSVLEADPRRTEALIERGHVARRQEDHEASLAAFETAGRNHPEHLGIRLEIVRSLRHLGRLDEAAARLDAIHADHPRDLGVLIEKGHLARKRGDHAGARDSFRTAHAVDSGHDGIRQELAASLVSLAAEAWSAGDPKRSAMLLDEALTVLPTHIPALLTRAEQALKADDPQRAMRYARRAADANRHNLEALLLGARAASLVPDQRRAMEFLEEAERGFAGRPELVASRIHVLRALGDNAAAGEVVATAGAASTHESLWAEVVSWRIAAGDFVGAGEILDRLAPALAASPQATLFRAQVAEARRDYGAAVAAYDAALAIEPGNGIWHAEAARAALLALDTAKARDHLQASMRLNASATIARGQSLNPSQHHTGQLIDEFSLDQPLLAALRRALAFSGAERTTALQRLVRAHPDSTAAATMLLLDLRRSGVFAPGRAGGTSPVPKQLAQFWDRKDPPPDIVRLMASWSNEEGFDYHLFDDRTAEAWLRRHAERDIARAFRRASHPAQRADIFRLAWLAREGGIYADADDRRLAPFADLLPGAAAFVAYQENYGSIANNFLAATPGHPVILRALRLAVTALNRGDRDYVWLATGPGLMTRAMAQVLAEDEAGEVLTGMLIRELHEMRRLVEIHSPVAYKSTSAHWSRAVFERLKPRASRSRRSAVPERDPAA